MRKCRNWQTSKTKDLVHIACVWVQVPSSALKTKRLRRVIVWVFFVFNAEESLEPRVQGLLDLTVFVGRFGGKKVHWTFFYFHLTPSSAGEEIYNINKRSFKYGFTTATKIESTEKVSNYITKYITKELITMSKGQHRYLYSKNLAKPQSETLFEEDLKFMELLLSKNKDLVKIKKIKDEERGIETTYITIKKTE